MGRRRQELITLGLTLLVLLLAGLNSAFYFTRIDLTSDRVFSLSEVSREMAREIPEPLRVTYYLSDRLRSRAVETEQIVDLLREYEAHSLGRIEVRVVDPAAAGLGAEAESLGVMPQQIQVVEHDQQSLATVYTGVVISYLDRHRSLPVVFDPRTFEYEFTSTMRNLVRDYTPRVEVLLGRREESLQREYQLLLSGLSRHFTVESAAPGAPISPSVDALFVIGGRDLDEGHIDAVENYLAGGGRVLFALDGVSVDLETQSLDAAAVGDLPVHRLLEQYGVRIGRELVLDEYHRRIPVARPAGGMTVQSMEPYPPWVSVVAYNTRHPITARFTGVDLYWPSPLYFDLNDDVEVLLESSSRAWLMEQPFVTSPLQPDAMERGRRETRGRYTLAAVVSGRPHPQSRMVVVGDSDFLSNLLQYTGSEHNIDFAENVAGWLALDEDLLSIRPRAARDMRLNRIEDPAARRRVAGFARTVNTILIPVAVVLFGLLRFMRRRRHALRSQDVGPRDEQALRDETPPGQTEEKTP